MNQHIEIVTQLAPILMIATFASGPSIGACVQTLSAGAVANYAGADDSDRTGTSLR